MELIERYNTLLKGAEDVHISRLNTVLDKSFNRLVRRLRWHIRNSYLDETQRNFLVLQDFRQLIPLTNPVKADQYDRVFTDLLLQSSRYGSDIAKQLTMNLRLPQRIDVEIPLEATLAAVEQAKGYLRRHGNTFAETSATTVAQGIAEGRPTDLMISDLQKRLGVVKSRAENIVRTESLRAYNTASDRYYSSNGVQYVMYYATADDRTCLICTNRAANIYKRTEIQVPLHPRCRCYLAPWMEDEASMDESYASIRQAHQRDIEAETANLRSPLQLNKAALFEQFAPTPVSP